MSEQPTEEQPHHDEPHPSSIGPDPDEKWETDWPWDKEDG